MDSAFVGKGLPPSSEQKAWSVALERFQEHGKAVTLSAELVYRPNNRDGPLYDLILHPLKFEVSHRLSRRFGADRFLEVTIPSSTAKDQPALVKDDENRSEKIITWLTQKPHYFLGRRWVAFHTRDMTKTINDPKSPDQIKKVYPDRVCFFAVDGDHFRNPYPIDLVFPAPEEALTLEKRTKLNLHHLLEWAVGLSKNLDQPVPKLFSRLSLSM